MKRRIEPFILCILCIVSSMVTFAIGTETTSQNTMGYSPAHKTVTIGDSFRYDIYGDICLEIDTIAADNITYLPSGVINYTSCSKGSLFDDLYQTSFQQPRPSTINNKQGWCKPFVWSVDNEGIVNNTNRTAFNITWNARGVGRATFTITQGGTARAGKDLVTVKKTGTVSVHPQKPQDLQSKPHSSDSIQLTWTKGTGAERTVVRGSQIEYPTSVNAGKLIYNDSKSSCTHTISKGETWFYSAWSIAQNLTSVHYASTTASLQNNPPFYSSETPGNQSKKIPISLDVLSIDIEDYDGDDFDWSITTNPDIGNSSGFDQTNGTKTCSISNLADDTIYTWYVQTTDGYTWKNNSYYFTTESSTNHHPDAPNSPSPTHNSNSISLAPPLSVDVFDSDGDDLTVSFYDASDDNVIGTDTVTSGSGTASVFWSNANQYSTTYSWYVKSDDGAATSQSDTWQFTTITEPENHPPTLSPESPADQSTDVPITTNSLSVDIQDIDGDRINWTIESESNIGSNQGTDDGSGIKTCTISGLNYATTYRWYVNATDGRDWTNQTYRFTTENTPETPSGDTPGNPGEQPPPSQDTQIPSEQPPVADAGESYMGFVHQLIIFDASNSSTSSDSIDIISYFWDFDDGSNDTGKIASHVYTQPGIYEITLTVTDENELQDTDTALVDIRKPNTPPTQPYITIPARPAIKDTSYAISVRSTDPDNDTIRYIFDWGDESFNTITTYTQQNTTINETHQWNNIGVYKIRVYAEDTYGAQSSISEDLILIDVYVHFINDVISGYLIDYDQNTIYNVFYNNATGNQTTVEHQPTQNTYLIDSNADNKWDYIYDPTTRVLTEYHPPASTQSYILPLPMLAIIAIAILVIAVIIYFYKKGAF